MVIGPALAVALVVLTAVAVLVTRLGCLDGGLATLVAAVRATVQLALVALVLVAVVGSASLTVLFVLSMFSVASWTASRRLAPHSHGARRERFSAAATKAGWVAVPLAMSTGPVVLGLLAAGVVPTQSLAVVPVAGILIGGAMTATALAGRRALDELRARKGEVEAGMALGLLPRDAALEVCRPTAAQALVPGLDQTRTVGLVALPGSFVGSLLGGATPAEAGAVQLLILVSLLAVQAICVVTIVELAARGTFSHFH